MPGIAIVTTTNARAQVLHDFVHYHLNLGIAHIYLYYDDPAKSVRAAAWPGERVTATHCNPEYWAAHAMTRPGLVSQRQICNATHALSQVRRAGYDWIAHLDTDELLYAAVPLDKVLQSIPRSANRVICSLYEALPERDNYQRAFLEISTFRRKPSTRQAKWLHRLPLGRAMLGGAYLKGHHNSKSLVRTAAPVERLGIHRPLTSQGRPLPGFTSELLHLLHFDAQGLADWQRKWDRRLDGTRAVPNMRPHRRWQLEAYRQAAASGTTEQLYRKLYKLPGYEKAMLRALGLLRNITIDRDMFAPVAIAASAEVNT